MTKHPDEAAGDLSADLAALRKDVAHLAETMRELVQHQAQAAGHRVSEAVDDVREQISSTASDAQDRVQSAAGDIEKSIKHNPLTAVLIALGLGVSLGLISRARG